MGFQAIIDKAMSGIDNIMVSEGQKGNKPDMEGIFVPSSSKMLSSSSSLSDVKPNVVSNGSKGSNADDLADRVSLLISSLGL